jgi:glycine/D-amino acid oxidase-like deaminating enzyme
VLTNLTAADKTITTQKKDGTWSFIIPRSFNGGTVIGGTKEVGNWQLEPSQETQSQLLKAAQPIIPQACDKKQTPETIKVIKDVVGRRPAREGGMRVETEARDTTWGVKHAIHAYGAGGRGFELSWGVASEVAELASEILESQSSVRPKL